MQEATGKVYSAKGSRELSQKRWEKKLPGAFMNQFSISVEDELIRSGQSVGITSGPTEADAMDEGMEPGRDD